MKATHMFGGTLLATTLAIVGSALMPPALDARAPATYTCVSAGSRLTNLQCASTARTRTDRNQTNRRE